MTVFIEAKFPSNRGRAFVAIRRDRVFPRKFYLGLKDSAVLLDEAQATDLINKFADLLEGGSDD